VPIPGRKPNLIVLESRRKSKRDSSPSVDQLKLETILGMRRELQELEESVGVALSKGARIEPGVHTAQLVPERRRGEFFMKLIILIFLLATLTSACSRPAVIEDVNGDGRIDLQDIMESAPDPSREMESPLA